MGILLKTSSDYLIKNIGDYPSSVEGYLRLLSGLPLLSEMEESLSFFNEESLWNQFAAIGDEVYHPGKWTVRQILRHLLDTEIVFSYRSLCFARGEKSQLPGFNENDYAACSYPHLSSVDSLREDLKLQRKATLSLFRSFSPDVMLLHGKFGEREMSVLGIGFLMLGHFKHHMNIIKERYLALIK